MIIRYILKHNGIKHCNLVQVQILTPLHPDRGLRKKVAPNDVENVLFANSLLLRCQCQLFSIVVMKGNIPAGETSNSLSFPPSVDWLSHNRAVTTATAAAGISILREHPLTGLAG